MTISSVCACRAAKVIATAVVAVDLPLLVVVVAAGGSSVSDETIVSVGSIGGTVFATCSAKISFFVKRITI